MPEQLSDKNLECVDCGKPFVFTVRDQDFFKQKGFSEPKRCRPCRDLKKQARTDVNYNR